MSFGAGKTFLELIKRPNLTREDAVAIARESPSIAMMDVWLGADGQLDAARVYYGSSRTTQLTIYGATENYAAVNFAKLELGRFFIRAEVDHRRQVVVLGQTPATSLFPNIDPIGKRVRIGAERVHRGRRPRQASIAWRLLARRRTTSSSSRSPPTRSSTAKC